MNKNKTIILFTVLVAILFITVPTIWNIYQNHSNRLYEVATKKILESAENCFYDDVCKGNQITIGALKKNGYLTSDVVNPKTRTYFDDSLTLIHENFQVRFA